MTQALAAAPPATAPHFYAQAGAFADKENAERLAERLRNAGVGKVAINESRVDGRRLFRVRVGPVAGVAEFDSLIERLRQTGVEGARLALD